MNKVEQRANRENSEREHTNKCTCKPSLDLLQYSRFLGKQRYQANVQCLEKQSRRPRGERDLTRYK